MVAVLPLNVPVPEAAREIAVLAATGKGLPLASREVTVTEKFAPAVVLPGTLVMAS